MNVPPPELINITLDTLTAQVSEWPLSRHKPTLVFIHGAGFHGGFWQPQYPLAAQFNLVCLNLPGRRTAQPCEADLHVYADRAEAALAQLGQSVVVIGHSMGGAVAQIIMRRQPSWLAAGVLACTGARLKVAPVVNQLFAQGGAVFMQVFSQSGPGLSMQQVAALSQQMAKTQTGISDFMACNRFDMMAELVHIKRPCLVVCGDKDLLTPEKYSQFLHQHISGSQIALVQGAGHLLPWESPQTFNQLISEFAHRYESHPVSTSD